MKYKLGFSLYYYDGKLYEMAYPIESTLGYADKSGYVLLTSGFRNLSVCV